MPIYEYRCEDCGHQVEIMQKMADPPATDCPDCQQPALKKQISAVAFRFKGGGWYETDFKTGDKKNLADGGDKAKTDDAGTTAAKTADGAASSKQSTPSTKPAKSDSAGNGSSSKPAASSTPASTPASTSAKPSGKGSK